MILNHKTIKFWEEFRPFARSVLRERVADYFPLDVDCPFMTLTLDVRQEKRSVIPRVVHVDGSGRLQTVSREDQPLYHRLIQRLAELTGEAVVLNISYNLAGEPIVCTPFDARLHARLPRSRFAYLFAVLAPWLFLGGLPPLMRGGWKDIKRCSLSIS